MTARGFLYAHVIMYGKRREYQHVATVVSVTNQKGGVGKTTTAVNLAYYMAKTGKKTLLIDFDPQGNATSGLGINKQDLILTMADVVMGQATIEQVVIQMSNKNFFLAPSTPHLADTEVQLAQAERRFSRLKNAIELNTGEYDVVIVDNPPSLSLLTVNGIVAAKYILIPVQVEFYALEGLGQLLETMKLVRKGMNPTLELLGVLPTMMDVRTTLGGQVYQEILKHFPGKVLETIIPRNVRLAEAPSHGLPIGAYDKFSKGARAYKALTKEVMSRANI